jgi:hypothetical protein
MWWWVPLLRFLTPLRGDQEEMKAQINGGGKPKKKKKNLNEKLEREGKRKILIKTKK